METKNQTQIDLTVNNIENVVKNGEDDTQKVVLFEKLKNLAITNPIEGKTDQIIPNKKSKVFPQFPDEIWLKIIGYMKTRDVFGSFALSCKRFNNLTKDSRAIKFLHLKRIETWESFGKMMKVAKNSKNLIELQINEFWRESHIAFHYFKNHHETNPKLKLLKIGEIIGYSEYECFQNVYQTVFSYSLPWYLSQI